MSPSRRLAVLATLVLLASALAGCMEGLPGGDDPSDLTSEEARQRFTDAMRNVNTRGSGLPPQIAVNHTFVADEGDGTVFLDMYVDAESNELIVEASGSELGSGAPGTQMGSMVVAQMGKSVFFGEPTNLLGFYNDSADPVESFQDLSNGTLADAGQGGGAPGSGFFDEADNLSEEFEFEASSITYEEKDAIEITSVDDDEGKASFRAVLWLDPLRPALVEVTVPEDAAGNQTVAPQAGEVTMRFQYGEDADHPRRAGLVRLETLVFTSDEEFDPQPGGGEDDRWTNHTIQPARETGVVPLEEVTAHVTNRTRQGEDETVIEMGLEEGSAQADQARLTYEDVDGDGMVSEGDEVTLERLDENATLAFQLEDETTGMKLSPSAGALAALAAAGAAALLGRRRRA